MDFPDLQKKIWETVNGEPAFLSKQQFPTLNNMEYVKDIIQKISSEDGLRTYEHETVENMVQGGLAKIYEDQVLRDKFPLQGEVIFESHLQLEQKARCLMIP